MKHHTVRVLSGNYLIRVLSAILMVGFVISFGSGAATTRAKDGVEIGNGRKLDDRGGFEIGNGSITNGSGLYRLKQMFGRWQVGFFEKYTEIIALEGTPRTRVHIDVLKKERILSLSDLVASRPDESWILVKLGDAWGLKKDTVSASSIRDVEYQLFRAPGEVISVTLVGNQGEPEYSAFEKIHRSLETFEFLVGS